MVEIVLAWYVAVCIVYLAKSSQGRTKYNIDPAHFVVVLIDRGQPPLEASRKAPCGYWFFVAVSLSGCSRPSDKYVLAVYKYWRSNRGNLHTLLGNRKDHDMSDGYEYDGNIDDCDDKSDEDVDEERDPHFLVPTYNNQPDPDDLCALKWGKDHYMRYLLSMKRKPYT